MDAEHVVILMQENRSFDHVFGRLRGVRGFNDPRAVTLPDGKPVWLQIERRGRNLRPIPSGPEEKQSDLAGIAAAFVARPDRCPQPWQPRRVARCKTFGA